MRWQTRRKSISTSYGRRPNKPVLPTSHMSRREVYLEDIPLEEAWQRLTTALRKAGLWQPLPDYPGRADEGRTHDARLNGYAECRPESRVHDIARRVFAPLGPDLQNLEVVVDREDEILIVADLNA